MMIAPLGPQVVLQSTQEFGDGHLIRRLLRFLHCRGKSRIQQLSLINAGTPRHVDERKIRPMPRENRVP